MSSSSNERKELLCEKVFAYVTRGTELLVFRERGFEPFGLQIPAGSVELNESLEEAVLREIREETGLSDLHIKEYLGAVEVDQSKYGLEEIHRRHFYHVITSESTPSTWWNEEEDPSIVTEYTPDCIILDLFWISLLKARPILAEGHDAFLSVVVERVAR